MGRKYVRDRRGRFASVGATARGGRLTNLSGKRYDRKTMTAGARTNVLRPGAVRPAAVAAPSGDVPRSGRVPFSRPPARNNIRDTRGALADGRGWADRAGRRMERAVDRLDQTIEKARETVKRGRNIIDRIDRADTRSALSGSAMDREIARQGGLTMRARAVVERRMQRAFNVQNGRNPQVGARALFVYQAQLRQLGAPSNQRVRFRRKPMSPQEAARAKAKREAANRQRLMQAIKEDTKRAVDAKMAAKKQRAKPPRKPRKKKP